MSVPGIPDDRKRQAQSHFQSLPLEIKSNQGLLTKIRKNLEYSPSFKENLEKGEWERRMLGRVERMVDGKG